MIDAELYFALLDHQGLPALSSERIDAALEAHHAMRPSLEALRQVPLSYLEPVVEPTSALAWIAAGGKPAGAVEA